MHSELLLSSYTSLTGKTLIAGNSAKERAKALFEAPFFVASHDNSVDPVLTYGNQTAIELFEMTWSEFTKTHSRFTAEKLERAERERLLTAVASKGYIDDYSGIRISSTGRRFRIHQATVWNLLNSSGVKIGQAATFSHWDYLESG